LENKDAEFAIRALVARYCDAVNRYDSADWASTWAPDGQWHFLGQVHKGRESILAFWLSVMAQLDFAIMLANSAIIRCDGDGKRATGRWYTQEIVRTRGEPGRSIVGVYDDVYHCATGEWLIQSRRYHKLYEAHTPPSEMHWPYCGSEDPQ